MGKSTYDAQTLIVLKLLIVLCEKIVVLGVDFLQILPVIPKGTRQ